MTQRTTGHAALAVLPRAGQLIAARRTFDDASASVEDRIAAALVMIEIGPTAFDQGRARAFLRDQGVRA
jgi:hypothetical protein